MRKKFPFPLSHFQPIAYVAALVCTIPGAWAQSAAELKPVVITATRSAVYTADAPAAVSVVTQDDIENRNVSRISDALLKVPSLYMGRGESGQSNSSEGGFSLRGMSTNRTLVLLDGLQPLQNGNSQGVNWQTVFVDDVERVEVVPGAFASLYGSNAMGGVINVISKRPDQQELTVRLKRGFHDAAGTDASVYIRGKLPSGLGITVGLSRVDRAGYASERTVRTPVAGAPGTAVTGAIPTTTRDGTSAYIVGDRGTQPWQQSHATAKLSYDFSATDRIYAGLAFAEMQQGFTRFNSYLRNSATGAEVSSGTLGLGGQRVTLTEANFVGSTPINDSSKRYFSGYEGLLGKDYKLNIDVARIDRQFSFPTVGATSTWNAGSGSLSEAPNSSLDTTATLSFPLGKQHFVVTGFSLHRDTVERRGYTLTHWRDPDSKTSITNGYNGNSTTTSVFAQDEFAVTDRVTLYTGGRLDRWETQGDFFQNTAPVSTAAYAQRSKTTFNPKLSGVYKPVDDITLRASWGQSFRAPSNLDLYSTTVQSSSVSPTGLLTIQSDPNLKPEHGTSWEIGGEWRVNSNAKTTATYYDTRLKDMIYSKQINNSLTQRINAGEAQVRGVELGMVTKLAPWLELNTNLSWMDSQVLDNSADPLSVGKRLTQVPHKLAYLGLTAARGPWSGTLEARFSGATHITAQNTDTVQGVPGSNDAYTLVNLKLGYQVQTAVRLNLAVNNLTDREAYVFAQLPRRNATVEMVLSF
ncbi:MAG: TonB-dependent receptor [Pseudomonadota bacterium]